MLLREFLKRLHRGCELRAVEKQFDSGDAIAAEREYFDSRDGAGFRVGDEGAGLLTREESPPPVAATLYTLTERGNALAPVISPRADRRAR